MNSIGEDRSMPKGRNKFVRILKSLELCFRLDKKFSFFENKLREVEDLERLNSKRGEEFGGALMSLKSRIDSSESDCSDKLQKIEETLDGLNSRHPVQNIINMPNVALRSHALKILGLVKPYDVIGGRMVRIGRDFDGGYVMLDKGLSATVAYSLGISDDVSWDLDMAERGCDLFQYDHTINRLPRDHVNFHWHKLGIGPRSASNRELKSLSQVLDDNGHSERSDLILKMDIEGSEWRTIEEETSETLNKFSQLVIEFHWLTHLYDPNHLRRFVDTLDKINLTHRVVHVHANNYGHVALIGGVLIPDSLEITFVRILDNDFSESTKTFPTNLDMPCDPNKGDIFLGVLGKIAVDL